VDSSFVFTLLDVFGFFGSVEVLSIDQIEIVGFPVSLGGFSFLNFFIGYDFLIVMFQIFVRNNVVVFKVFIFVFWNFDLKMKK
jgi:hypothetical protein